MDELLTEARTLIEALLQRVEPWLQDGLAEPGSAGAATDCRWCPICTVAAAPHGEHPQLPPWVVERGAGWLRAVRAMLTQHPPTRPQTPTATTEPPAPRVQRIPVRVTDSTL